MFENVSVTYIKIANFVNRLHVTCYVNTVTYLNSERVSNLFLLTLDHVG